MSWLSHTGRLPLDGEEDTRTERWVRAHPRLSVAIPPGLFACFRLPVAIRAFTRGEPTSGWLYLVLTAFEVVGWGLVARHLRNRAFRKGDE